LPKAISLTKSLAEMITMSVPLRPNWFLIIEVFIVDL